MDVFSQSEFEEAGLKGLSQLELDIHDERNVFQRVLSLATQAFSFKNSFLFKILVLVVIEIWLHFTILVTQNNYTIQ